MKHTRSRKRRRVLVLVLVTAGAAASPVRAGLVDTTWSGGGTGLWSGTSNWSSGRPNNNVPSGTTYNALIDGGAPGSSVVTLDMNATIIGLWITTGDQLNINNARSLVIAGDGLAGTISNGGQVHLNSTGGNSDLVLNAGITLSGGGTISLVSAARVRGSGSLINLDNVIEGQGSLGYNAISITNQGLVSANVAGGTLTLDPVAAGTFSNSGTLAASGGGTLVLTGNYGGTFINAGGTIIAADASQVRLASGVAIEGGTLTSSGNGTIAVASSDGTISNLANTGHLVAENGAALHVLGDVANSGSITLNSTGSATDFILDGQATLAGSGTLLLISIARIGGSGTLINMNNAIAGEGSIGFNQVSLVNHGLIDANVPGKPLIVDPPPAGQASNSGTMQASGGGTLTLTGNFGGAFENSGGVIQALDGSQVRIVSGVVINGGTLSTQGSGTIGIASSDGTFSNIANTGDVVIENGAQLSILGRIANMGSININATTWSGIGIGGAGSATLSGGGTILLNGAYAQINGSGTLTNSANVLRGRGWIGRNALSVVNQGTIVAAGGVLNLDPPATGMFTNNGLVKVTSGSTLELDGNAGGGFDGAGSIQIESGATMTIVGSPPLVAGDIFNDGVINHVVTASVGHVDGSGTLNIASGTLTADSIRQNTLNLPAATSAVMRPSGGLAPVSRVNTLSMTATSLIDLGDNDLLIDYTGSSPYSAIRTYIKNAWHDGARNGKGITSSSADAVRFTLGYAENSDLGLEIFGDESIDPSCVLVKYTFYGDSNLDGRVDIRDLYQLAAHWEATNVDWTRGDFNFDNLVNAADLTFIAINWQAGVSAPLGAPLDSILGSLDLPSVSVPEPLYMTGGSLLLFSLIRQANRRSRRTL